jgi:hypothetical protein
MPQTNTVHIMRMELLLVFFVLVLVSVPAMSPPPTFRL